MCHVRTKLLSEKYHNMPIMSYGQSLPESASGHPGHRDRALRTCGIDKQKVVVLGAREVFPPLFEGLAAQYFNSMNADLYGIYNDIWE
jgi:hypothetical protein